MTTDSVGHRCVGTISGQPLAELLLCTRGALLRVLQLKQLSARYLRHARHIIEEYADFCRSQVEGNPWQLRERFLAAWPEHRALQGRSCGRVLRHHAQVVTRRHLIWLEQQGHLPAGSRAAGSGGLAADTTEDDPQALLEHMVAKVQRQVPELPEGLRQPLLDYLEHLIYQRGLVQATLESILHTQLALCRQLASAGHECYARLGAAELDQVVGSLLSAPPEREHLLRRRQQIHAHHSRLRGLLRYLRGRGLLQQDLSRVLISPPCYQASKPSTVLSQQQVHSLLQAVDRGQAGGRRAYAILMLMTTYGLRPIDVSRLRLDDLHWRRGQVALVQKKTGRALTLPLLPEVVTALSDYLREDRVPGLLDRRVFVSLNWPHRPLCSKRISRIVAQALREARLGWARPKHLRSTVATHLLRQGEAHSTIEQLLGHCSAATTQRYAVTDVELLRQVLKESEQ